MSGVVIEPLLAGLSTGLFCCLSCYPIMAPVLAAEDHSWRQILGRWLQFLGGRLMGYILFGALVGMLGERVGPGIWNTLATWALLLMSGWMILYALGFWRPRWSLCAAGSAQARTTPLLLGLLVGLRACPPMILSLTYVFMLHNMLKGILYFTIFFAATCLYLIPLLLVGRLGRVAEFRTAARVSTLLVGILFLIHAIVQL